MQVVYRFTYRAKNGHWEILAEHYQLRSFSETDTEIYGALKTVLGEAQPLFPALFRLIQ